MKISDCGPKIIWVFHLVFPLYSRNQNIQAIQKLLEISIPFIHIFSKLYVIFGCQSPSSRRGIAFKYHLCWIPVLLLFVIKCVSSISEKLPVPVIFKPTERPCSHCFWLLSSYQNFKFPIWNCCSYEDITLIFVLLFAFSSIISFNNK